MTSGALDFKNTPNIFNLQQNWIDGNTIRTAQNINRNINTVNDLTSFLTLFYFEALIYYITELLNPGGSSCPAMDTFIFTEPYFRYVLKI